MPSLDAIAEPFQMVEPEMRLELLLEYAGKLPPLPERYHALRDAGLNMVHECQSPVFLQVEVEENGADDEKASGGESGTVRLYSDVPKKAPTARAFVSILTEAFDGVPARDVLEAPDDPLHRLGLTKLLGMQRTHGLSAIYRRVKSEVARKAAAAEGPTPEKTP